MLVSNYSAPIALRKTGRPRFPGIMLLPAMGGVSDYVKCAAERLSASAFAVVTFDYLAREGGSPDVSSLAAIDVAVNSLPPHRI